jgi:hypothetical protein
VEAVVCDAGLAGRVYEDVFLYVCVVNDRKKGTSKSVEEVTRNGERAYTLEIAMNYMV